MPVRSTLFGSTGDAISEPPPGDVGGRHMTGLVAHLRTPIPAQGTSQPQVQDVIHAIESLPESTQAFALSSELRNHVGNQPAQVEFRTELMQGLGADQVGGMLAAAPQIDGIYSRGVAERAVLAAASTVYSPQEQGQLVHQL